MSRLEMTTADRLRTVVGYCLIAFANSLLPALVSSAAYLIVPYPRPIVIVIQTVPAVATKILLPYALPRIESSRQYGPLLLAVCWIIAVFIIDISPPNVPPWIRVIGVVLASFASASGEVFWLRRLSIDGKNGLAGWAVGGGVGGFACAVLPYIVTVYMGHPLRDGLRYAWYLVPMILGSHYLVLPHSPSGSKTATGRTFKGQEAMKHDVESSVYLLREVAPEPETAGGRSVKAKSLLRQFVMPLVVAFTGQSFAVPGMSRAMAFQPIFETHSQFLAAYCGVFHLGSLTARSAMFFEKPASKRSSLLGLAIASFCLVWIARFPSTTMPILCFPVVWLLGAAIGSLYVKVFDSAVEEQVHETIADREFRLGFVGVGESLGLLVGSSAGAMLEASLCGLPFDESERWCHMTW